MMLQPIKTDRSINRQCEVKIRVTAIIPRSSHGDKIISLDIVLRSSGTVFHLSDNTVNISIFLTFLRCLLLLLLHSVDKLLMYSHNTITIKLIFGDLMGSRHDTGGGGGRTILISLMMTISPFRLFR